MAPPDRVHRGDDNVVDFAARQERKKVDADVAELFAVFEDIDLDELLADFRRNQIGVEHLDDWCDSFDIVDWQMSGVPQTADPERD